LAAVPFHKINKGKVAIIKGNKENKENEGSAAKTNKETMLPRMIQPEMRTHQGIRPLARLL
jgi:hypothetical protein